MDADVRTPTRGKRPEKRPDQTLWFEDVEVHFFEIDGQPWIRRRDAMAALGYTQGSGIRSNVFLRWRAQFTEDLARKVAMQTPGGPQLTWMLSASGAQLLCMLARTQKAAAFRLWLIEAMRTSHAATVPRTPARHQ